MNQRVLACLLASSLFACGDDGGHPHTIPDSNHPADALTCSTVAGSNLDYAGYRAATATADAAIFWTGELGMLDGSPLYYDLEFWDGIEPSLSGTLDLGSGNQTGYDTCAVCVLAYTLDADGNFARAFFQTAGSINLAADPIATKNLNATFTGLKLGEISLSDATPITGGACMDYTDGSVMHDAVPNAWTCQHGQYNSGGNCTCKCGVIDPDCTDTATLEGCTADVGTNACFRAMCVTAPTNDTCETAGTIALGATGVTGTTAGAKHNYDKGLEGATCTNVAPDYAQPGPDVVYRTTTNLAAGTTYTVTLSGLATNMDLSVALLGPLPGTTPEAICKTGNLVDPITTCVAGADAGLNGENETFTYTVPTGGTGAYYLIVDSWNVNVGGVFTLKIQ